MFVFHIDIYNVVTVFIINVFVYATVRLFKFDKIPAVYAALLNKKNTLICYVFMLMFFGKACIRSCSNPVFQIQSKALTVAAIFDVFVGPVPGNCWTDAGYWLGYCTWRDGKSWDENFAGCAVFHQVCWFTKKKKQNYFFTLNFCFLRARVSANF